MALAVLNNIKQRVIALLNANPGVWSTTVSGTVGAFPSDSEILAAILEADEWVAVYGYFQSGNSALTRSFEIVSGLLADGASVPFYHGEPQNVELTSNGTTWIRGVETGLDDITSLKANSAYVGTDTQYLYTIENGHIFHTAQNARVSHLQYTRTSAPQCSQNEEMLIIYKAAANLTKNASPALFEVYQGEADKGLAMLLGDSQVAANG